MQLPNQDHVPSRSNYAFLPCHDTAHDLQATKETVGGTISTIKVPSHTAIWIKALRKGLVVPHPQEREEAQQPVYLSWLTRRSIAATIVGPRNDGGPASVSHRERNNQRLQKRQGKPRTWG